MNSNERINFNEKRFVIKWCCVNDDASKLGIEKECRYIK